jgi:lipoprotein-releasing system ATP-binding protein
MSIGQNLISAQAIIKTYKEAGKIVPVLRGIDIAIKQGEFVVIAGPSGAGKSTLLHILGGLDCPTSGKVLLQEQDIYALNDSERSKLRNKRIGFVFQFYHLLAEFSVLENVMLPALIANDLYPQPAKHLSRQDISKKALTILDTLGLKNRINFLPAKLSGGEKQRVAIARSLVNEPDIILCDEPTGNLDSHSGGEIRSNLVHLNRDRNCTVVVVTHQQDLFSECGRLVHIRDGLVKEELVLQEVK